MSKLCQWPDSDGDWTDIDCMSVDEEHSVELERQATCYGCEAENLVQGLMHELKICQPRSAYACDDMVKAFGKIHAAYHREYPRIRMPHLPYVLPQPVALHQNFSRGG